MGGKRQLSPETAVQKMEAAVQGGGGAGEPVQNDDVRLSFRRADAVLEISGRGLCMPLYTP